MSKITRQKILVSEKAQILGGKTLVKTLCADLYVYQKGGTFLCVIRAIPTALSMNPPGRLLQVH